MLLRKALIFSLFLLAVPTLNAQLPQLTHLLPLPELTTANKSPSETVSPQYTINPSPFFGVPAPSLARQHDILQKVSAGSQSFALDLLVMLTDVHVQARKDFIVSPFSIWSLLLPLSEGADGNTLAELRKVLRLTDDQRTIREAYRTVLTFLTLDTPTVKVASMQTIFTDLNQPVLRSFEDIVEQQYRADIFPIDFHNPIEAAKAINNEVRNATKNLISHAITPKDLENAKLVLLSALFFKGQWKSPFNSTMTQKEPFYDEDGQQIATVDMMMQIGHFNYTGLNELEGHVLELPYGKEERLSMLLILPKKGVSLTKIARNLQRIGVAAVLQKLAADNAGYEDDDVEVYMPKFQSSSDLSLTGLLIDMGISEIFNMNANLSKIADNVYVQNMIHQAKIIVDEEGTTASAVTIAVLTNKATPPKFYLNRPFMYLIVEKRTNTILFYGHLMNPNSSRRS